MVEALQNMDYVKMECKNTMETFYENAQNRNVFKRKIAKYFTKNKANKDGTLLGEKNN